METPAKLPLDILGYIVDIVGAFGRQPSIYAGTPSLKTLSLTCKFMVPICRRHLFSNINFALFTSRHLPWRNGRSEFLLSHPIITTHYLKNLVLDISQEFMISALEYDLLQIICDSSFLTSFHIRSIYMTWNEVPERLKSIILSLIQKPTLHHLTLERMNNFPAAAFSLCCGLTELTLKGIYKLAPHRADDAMQSPKITALVSSNCSVDDTLAVLMGPVGQSRVGEVNSMIGFDCLRDASFYISTQAEGFQLCQVLERATCLEKLEIQGDVYTIYFHSWSDEVHTY
ncbi:hypothetical protein HYPSUDRAFT_481475 [Hypholoma sublateritium FD-334 SS-4]|uniref:F-box domain-containing protein n=1 Tax=Hypholoma sublateritium (strain FD-334 SS-4) TaxID=945553 RepID=A0A0D2LBP5_HYPSF|nr:hypothetical protein HYPSUDRAFT_481475 [Hypholoma sublateritium FD-334 SS-4]